MSVKSEIARISNEVSTQTGLIAQISAALEGKAAGGGASIETCTVTLSIVFSPLSKEKYVVVYTDGSMNCRCVELADGESVSVAKGTLMMVEYADIPGNGYVIESTRAHIAPPLVETNIFDAKAAFYLIDTDQTIGTC